MNFDPIKVLVVDDRARARQSIKALLTTWRTGVETREAVDGREAVALAGSWRPDVVVMPGLAGLEATRMIKARWPETGVVILSLYGDDEAEARAAGADAFVTKGEPPAHLLDALDGVVRRSSG